MPAAALLDLNFAFISDSPGVESDSLVAHVSLERLSEVMYQEPREALGEKGPDRMECLRSLFILALCREQVSHQHHSLSLSEGPQPLTGCPPSRFAPIAWAC